MTAQVTVLHVDDDPEFLSLSPELLAGNDRPIRTITADDPTEALGVLRTTAVDCVVSDNVHLPDGRALVSAVRSQEPDLPIVLFSGKEWAEVRDVAEEAEVSEYVHKGGRGDFDVVAGHVLDAAGDEAGPTRDRATGSFADKPLTLEGGWDVVSFHDWDGSDEPGVEIVEAMEHYTGKDVEAFTPLYEALDPDALEQLLTAQDETRLENEVQVRFVWGDFELAVTNGGAVAIRPMPDLN